MTFCYSGFVTVFAEQKHAPKPLFIFLFATGYHPWLFL
jgi:hypothetical protein